MRKVIIKERLSLKNAKFIRLNSLFTKFMAVAAATLTGVIATNLKPNTTHAVTIVNSDTDIVTINYVSGYGIAIWDNPDNPQLKNSNKLQYVTSWRVSEITYDSQGSKWYDLGGGQWIEAKWTKVGLNSVDPYIALNQVASRSSSYSLSTQALNQVANTASYVNAASSNNYSSALTTSSISTTTSTTSSYTPIATGSEAGAKAWVANKESGGSYTIRNGQYYGKYQLSISYLNDDLPATNQEKVADNYVYSRYGPWTAARAFWLANGWY